MIEFKMFQVLFHKNFKKSLKKLSETEKKFIASKLSAILAEKKIGNIKKLKSYPLGTFRLKIGKFRLLFDIDFDQKIVIFNICRARKDLY